MRYCSWFEKNVSPELCVDCPRNSAEDLEDECEYYGRKEDV